MQLPADKIILPGGVPTGREILPEHTENNPPDSDHSLELDEFTKRALADIWDRFKYAETKITRDSEHYITKVEKLIADHRVTITYKRDSEHYITEQKVRVKMTTEFE